MRIADQWSETTASAEVTDAARARFLGIAARSMRQVLVEHARANRRVKRGGGQQRVTLGDAVESSGLALDQLLDLQAALEQLAQQSAPLAELAELRLFAGLSVQEIAEARRTSLSTAKNHWLLARTMLARWMSEPDWLQ